MKLLKAGRMILGKQPKYKALRKSIQGAKTDLEAGGYSGITEKQVALIFGSMCEYIWEELETGNEFVIPKFGTFYIRPKYRYFYQYIAYNLPLLGAKFFVRRRRNIETELKHALLEAYGIPDTRTDKPIGWDVLQKDWKNKIPYNP